MRFVSVLMAFMLLLVVTETWSAGLTPQELRGRQFYESGRVPSGRPVTAYFGKDLLEVPGESATCASCHGYDGQGRSESGVLPSNITWRRLMKSYGHVHSNGFEHGPFDESSLKRYMEDGMYPGGRQGDPSMPVYEMEAPDLDDLVAYLKRLDNTPDPGVGDAVIKIGTLLPKDGPLAERGEIMRRTIAAYFDDVNAQGGIYGRRLQLLNESVDRMDVLPAFRTPGSSDGGVFALLNTVTPGMENDLWRLVEQQHLPLVAPYAPLALDDQLLQRYRFFAVGGVREQALSLARFATQKSMPKIPRIRIVYQQRDGIMDVVSAVEAIYRSTGWNDIERVGSAGSDGLSAAELKKLRNDNPDLLLYLGGETGAEALFKTFGDPGSTTYLYLPGELAAKSVPTLPPSLGGRLWLSFSTFPTDRREWGLKEFSAMAARQQLPVSHLTLQLTARNAAGILVEGLRRTGRNLNRERFVETLEGMFEFDSGLAPLISYSRNRRVGTLGAHIVVFDPQQTESEGFLTHRGWIAISTP